MSVGRHLVLVVDDDLAVRDSLRFALELEGLEVHTCGGGDELFVHPRLADAACLVVDCEMPVMDGVEVVIQLRARHCSAPLILITGHATSALRRRAAAIGVHHLIEKPLLDSALIESIRQFAPREPRAGSDDAT